MYVGFTRSTSFFLGSGYIIQAVWGTQAAACHAKLAKSSRVQRQTVSCLCARCASRNVATVAPQRLTANGVRVRVFACVNERTNLPHVRGAWLLLGANCLHFNPSNSAAAAVAFLAARRALRSRANARFPCHRLPFDPQHVCELCASCLTPSPSAPIHHQHCSPRRQIVAILRTLAHLRTCTHTHTHQSDACLPASQPLAYHHQFARDMYTIYD